MPGLPNSDTDQGLTVERQPGDYGVNNLDTALTAAPGLRKAPAVAAAVATAGGNVASSARAVDYAGTRSVMATEASAINEDTGGGLLHVLGTGLGDVDKVAHYANEGTHGILGDVVGGLAKAANEGLSQVQHEWRYLHEVDAKEGFTAALAEGLAIAGIVATGTALTGGIGDIAGMAAVDAGAAGAEDLSTDVASNALQRGFQAMTRGRWGARAALVNLPTGMLAGQVAHRDLWNRTGGAGYVDPNTHQKVSFGRDIASGLFRLNPASTSYKALSGVLDGMADIWGDPLQATGSLIGEARSLNGAQNVLRNAGFTGRAMTWDNFAFKASEESGVAGSAVRRFVQWAADHGGAEIAREYPSLDPIIWDANYAADPEQQVVLAERQAALEKARFDLAGKRKLVRDVRNVTAEGEPTEEQIAKLPEDSRRYFENRNQVGQLLGPWEPTSRLEEYTIPRLERMIEHIQGDIDGIPTVTVKGLHSAKTYDEVMDVMRDRVIGKTESIGPMVPSRTLVKGAFSKVRDYFANARNPLAKAVNKWTTLVPGSLDREDRLWKASIDLYGLKRMRNLVNWLSPFIGQDATYELVNMMPDLDLEGRQLMLTRMFIMRLNGAAGLIDRPDLLDPESIEADLQAMTQPRVQEFIKDQLDNRWAPNNPEATGVFGTTLTGERPQPRLLPSGQKRAVAEMTSQAPTSVELPSFQEMRSAGRMLRNGHDLLGGVDDFMYKYVTSWMKPAMLFSVGFPVHMTAAEMLEWVNKEGLLGAAKAAYKAAATKLAYEGDDQDLGRMLQYVERVMPGASRDPKQMERLMSLAMQTEGHMILPDNLAGHFYVDPIVTPSKARRGWKFIMGDDYELRSLGTQLDENGVPIYQEENSADREAANEQHLYDWRSWIRQAGKSEPHRAAAKAMLDLYRSGEEVTPGAIRKAGTDAFRRALDDLSTDELDRMHAAQYKVAGSPMSKSPMDDWADQGVETTLAMTHRAQEGAQRYLEAVPHERTEGLLDSIVKGNRPSENFMRQIPLADRPRAVMGRQIIALDRKHFLAQLVDEGFNKVFSSIVHNFARRPMMVQKYLELADAYEPMVEQGLMSEEEMLVKAASDAAIDNTRYMHNPHERTYFDEMMRNYFPFFFAQSQAYRRAGRLLFDDPGAFRRFQLEIASMGNFVSTSQDTEGNNYITLPGSGFFTHAMLAGLSFFAPSVGLNSSGYGGTYSSMNIVFPMSQGPRPDISPVVAVPVKWLNNIFATDSMTYNSFQPFAQAAQGLTGAVLGPIGSDESTLEAFIPNETLLRASKALGGTSLNNAQMQVIANLAEQGLIPDPKTANDASIQQFLARVRNQAIIVQMGAAMVGFVSPIGADVSVNDFGLRADLTNDINRYGITKGYTEFLRRNPDALPYEVAESSTIDNIPLKDSVQAMQWVNDRLPEIIQNPSLLYLMPQSFSDQYDPTVYAQQVADGLRTRDTPQEFLDNIYAQLYSQQYFNSYDQFTADLASNQGNTQGENNAYTRWDSFLAALQQSNPIGYRTFVQNNKENNAAAVISGLRRAFSTGTAPAGAQTDLVKSLLGQFDAAEEAYRQAETSPDYSTEEKNVRTSWQVYCQQVAKDTPQLAPVISAVFRDALTSTNPTN